MALYVAAYVSTAIGNAVVKREIFCNERRLVRAVASDIAKYKTFLVLQALERAYGMCIEEETMDRNPILMRNYTAISGEFINGLNRLQLENMKMGYGSKRRNF